VRWYPELEACLARLLDRPGAKQDPELRALLLVGLYQLLRGATPEHAAVSETVEAARALGRPRAAGLVNAILRRFQRERAEVLAAAHGNRAAKHAHPAWMLDAFARDWPERWESIAAAGNVEPPMWLRVNARRGGRDAGRSHETICTKYRSRRGAADRPARRRRRRRAPDACSAAASAGSNASTCRDATRGAGASAAASARRDWRDCRSWGRRCR